MKFSQTNLRRRVNMPYKALRLACAVYLLASLAVAPAFAQEQGRSVYTPAPAGTSKPFVAKHGLVVTQEALSAHVGADILRRGGNAVDAAVATGFAMAVSYPRAGNIGGGGFMVIHLAERNEDIAIDCSPSAPLRQIEGLHEGRISGSS